MNAVELSIWKTIKPHCSVNGLYIDATDVNKIVVEIAANLFADGLVSDTPPLGANVMAQRRRLEAAPEMETPQADVEARQAALDMQYEGGPPEKDPLDE